MGILQKNKISVGIDISDHSIEVVAIEKNDNDIFNVLGSARAVLDAGLVEQGRVRNTKKLKRILNALIRKSLPVSVRASKFTFSLPDDQVYTQVFRSKVSEKKGIKQVVANKLKKSIPFPEEDVLYSYKVIRHYENYSGAEELLIVLIAATKETVKEWASFFTEAGLNIEHYETEALSLFRGMFREHPSGPLALLDIGAYNSQFSIFSRHGIELSLSSKIAGHKMTSMVALSEDKNLRPAENIKKNKKAAQSEASMKVMAETVFSPLFEEIDEAVKLYNNNYRTDGGDSLGKVLITGGGSQLHGLVEMVNCSEYSYRVELGKTFFRDPLLDKYYIQAVGSAIRGLEEKWENTDPFLVLYGHASSTNVRSAKAVKTTDRSKIFLFFKKSLIYLAVLLSILLLALLFPMFGRDEQKNTGEETFNTYIHLFGKEDPGQPRLFKARIIELTQTEEADPRDIVAGQREAASSGLYEGEFIFTEPLNDPRQADEIEFPLKISWLALDAIEIKERCLEQARLKFTNEEISVLDVDIVKLDRVPGTERLGLVVQCSVSSPHELLEDDTFGSKEINNQESLYTVRVNNLASKLNIRSGPGTNYDIIDSTVPGQEFLHLDEQEDWYKIKIEAGRTGWVSAYYTEKIEAVKKP